MKISIEHALSFIDKDALTKFKVKAKEANKLLHTKEGKGSDFLGWVELPSNINKELLSNIDSLVHKLRNKIDFMVTIGIGGSYLGAKAVIEALSDNFHQYKTKNNVPEVIFAGQNLSEDYLYELRDLLKDKDYAITVISKSGTTTEPAVTFRILKEDIEQKYGYEEAKNRIIAITDKEKGALKKLADKEGYTSFIIPDDVGGRFSVLTPVGLIPIAFAGYDIRELIKGASEMMKETDSSVDFDLNIAEQYALIRNLLYQNLFTIEILVNYNPKLNYFSEWWKQLYGESEGKDLKGIFPASVSFTTDLHSLGQYIQDGKRTLFETVLTVEKTKYEIVLKEDDENLDNLNYLAGKRIEEINRNAENGTRLAHLEGSVPNLTISISELNEFNLGKLIYFFEKACGISGYILDVNPFDQPGVEAYKKKMFELLGKPGY